MENEEESLLRKIFINDWFLHLCLYLFPICLVYNWLSEYPNRIVDIFGLGSLFIIVFMYFFGMMWSFGCGIKYYFETFWYHYF